ncbi:hypothetical protein EDM57_12485 [Brevibacillus gelatini]|uniref:Uncharacterized protein n=1 Tax=Brevibacillus gelatini TaxID=1655277 RepID=A0A3M8AZY1_9BACL|nr:hypothetical protein [Brevibacillus gelatini]RNB56610.1 hypothetical protein EDM57_12485 [Brevibacillus gelatini]
MSRPPLSLSYTTLRCFLVHVRTVHSQSETTPPTQKEQFTQEGARQLEDQDKQGAGSQKKISEQKANYIMAIEDRDFPL